MGKHDHRPPRRCELCDLRREQLRREEELRRIEHGKQDIERGIKELQKGLRCLNRPFC